MDRKVGGARGTREQEDTMPHRRAPHRLLSLASLATLCLGGCLAEHAIGLSGDVVAGGHDAGGAPDLPQGSPTGTCAPPSLPACPAAPVTLATGLHTPRAIAVDACSAWFIDSGNGQTGALMRLDLDGSPPVAVSPVAGDFSLDVDLAVDADAVYYTRPGNDGAGAIWSYTKASGVTTELTRTTSGGTSPGVNRFSGSPRRIALDAQYVYFTADGPLESATDPRPSRGAAIAARTSRASATGAFSIIADAGDTFVGAALNAGTLYLASDDSADLTIVNALTGADAGAHVQTLSANRHIAVDANAIFTATGKAGLGGPLFIVPITGAWNPPASANATDVGDDAVTDLALDDTRVYFTTLSAAGTDGHVLALGKDGTGLVTLATGAATSVAVDATRVYYTTGDAVLSACK
jgi:hypothetical protein